MKYMYENNKHKFNYIAKCFNSLMVFLSYLARNILLREIDCPVLVCSENQWTPQSLLFGRVYVPFKGYLVHFISKFTLNRNSCVYTV